MPKSRPPGGLRQPTGASLGKAAGSGLFKREPLSRRLVQYRGLPWPQLRRPRHPHRPRRRPRRRRDLSPSFQALKPRPFAQTKTRAASRPAASRRGQALITRHPAAPIGRPCTGQAWIGWRASGPAPAGRGVFWFASTLRPCGRALGGRPAPPAPRGPRLGIAARAGGGACGLWSSDRGGRLRHARATPAVLWASAPPLLCCRWAAGTMHTPGSVGPSETRAVSGRSSERGARRGRTAFAGPEREGGRGARVLATVAPLGAGTDSRAGRGRGCAGSGGSVCPAPPYYALSLAPAAAPPSRLWARDYFQAMTSPDRVRR